MLRTTKRACALALWLLLAQRHDRRFATLRERSGYLGDIVFHGIDTARE